MARKKVEFSKVITKNALLHMDGKLANNVAEKTVKLAMIEIINELPLSDLACIFPFAVYNDLETVKFEVKTEVSDLGKTTYEAFKNKFNVILETL